jgi:hypothetical protein
MLDGGDAKPGQTQNTGVAKLGQKEDTGVAKPRENSGVAKPTQSFRIPLVTVFYNWYAQAYKSITPCNSHFAPMNTDTIDIGGAKPSADAGVAKPSECLHVALGIVFYNIGLKEGQVSTENLYNKWILRNLRRDVSRMINEYNMDVICLSEIGPISGKLEHALSKWMTPASAPDTSGQFPLVERMLRQLVDDAADWKASAMAHYGLLINSTTVKLVQEPSLVGLHRPHPARVAMKFKISPLTGGVEKPAETTEIWNTHCPTSTNHAYGIEARRGVWKTITETSASHSVVGGDLNMTRFQAVGFNNNSEATRQWKVHEPLQAKHGDLVLTRNVVAELLHMTIGKDYIADKSQRSTDGHNACALVLTYAVQRETRVARNTPVMLSPHPCIATTSVAKPDFASSKPTSVRTSTVGCDTSVAVPSQDEHDAHVPPASVPHPPRSCETGDAKPGLDESSQVLARSQPPLVMTSIVPRDFSDAMPDEGELDCHGQPHIDAPLVVMLSTAMDGSTGPPAEADSIVSLLNFLWWGDEFHAKDDDAFVKAGERLAENFQWIQKIREDYAPNHVPKPVSRQYQFERTEVAEMHNRYMNSLLWMPESVRDTYEQLQLETQQSFKGRGKDSHGKGKGKGKGEDITSSSVEKPAGKQLSPAARAHRLKKQTFNVCFFKAFGSKQLFWHLVKVGPDTQDLNELLRVWSEVKAGPAYQALLEASLQKSDDVTETKKRVTWCRMQMFNATRYYAPKEDYDKAVAAYEAAKLEWKALNRNMRHRGMYELLDAED